MNTTRHAEALRLMRLAFELETLAYAAERREERRQLYAAAHIARSTVSDCLARA